MKNIKDLVTGCVYLFKSLSCGNSCYFETEDEILEFKKLFNRHLNKYVSIHSLQLNIEGYRILVKVKDKRTIISNYRMERILSGKEINEVFISEPWRIISEKIRIIHSLFVRKVNKLRERSGVLVKKSYERYYFDSLEEAKYFIEGKGKNTKSQNNSKYNPIRSHCTVFCWAVHQTKEALELIGNQLISDLVALKYINRTIIAHSST